MTKYIINSISTFIASLITAFFAGIIIAVPIRIFMLVANIDMNYVSVAFTSFMVILVLDYLIKYIFGSYFVNIIKEISSSNALIYEQNEKIDELNNQFGRIKSIIERQ